MFLNPIHFLLSLFTFIGVFGLGLFNKSSSSAYTTNNYDNSTMGADNGAVVVRGSRNTVYQEDLSEEALENVLDFAQVQTEITGDSVDRVLDFAGGIVTDSQNLVDGATKQFSQRLGEAWSASKNPGLDYANTQLYTVAVLGLIIGGFIYFKKAK